MATLSQLSYGPNDSFCALFCATKSSDLSSFLAKALFYSLFRHRLFGDTTHAMEAISQLIYGPMVQGIEHP